VVLPFILIIVAYIGTLGFQFVYDDPAQVLHNTLLHSWSNLPGFFKHDVWSFNQVSGAPPTNYYRPVFLIWLLINYKLFGFQAWCWHLSTVGVHVLVTVLVYKLALELSRDRFTALFSAAIFGLHPVHIEAVAWISGVTESLVAAPFVASLLCHIKARTGSAGPASSGVSTTRAFQAASLVLCLIALLSKETAIVLPAAILLYEIVFREPVNAPARARQTWYAATVKAVQATSPHLITAAIYMAIRFEVLKGFGRSVFPLKLATIVLTWPSVIWFYIRLLVWPFGLSAFYDTPYVQTPGLRSFVVPFFLGALVCAGVVWYLARLCPPASRKSLIFCTGLIVLPILPLLNLSVFIDGEIAHDRYLYLPSIGFCILVGSLVRRVPFGLRVPFGSRTVAGLPFPQAAVALVLMVALAGGTALQIGFWSSDLLLYHRGFLAAPNNKVAKNNLAIELSKRGFYRDAIAMFETTLQAHPDDWIALANIGYDYFKIGRLDDAVRELTHAIEINSMSPGPFLTLGLAKQQQGKLDEAARCIREAINLRTNGDGFHEALGNVLRQQGDMKGSLAEFRKEIDYNPERSSARVQIDEVESILGTRRGQGEGNNR
jgi:Flp pilus assembly protein TadD